MFLSEKDPREIPCKTCKFENDCGDNDIECMAVRNWYYGGNYNDKDVGRLKRKIKTYKWCLIWNIKLTYVSNMIL